MIEWTDEEICYLHQLVNPPTTRLFALNKDLGHYQSRRDLVKYRLSQLLRIKHAKKEKEIQRKQHLVG